MVLVGVINTDYQGENWTAAPQRKGGRVCLEYRRFLSALLGTTMVNKVKEKVKLSNPDRITNGPEP